ncbi:MAG: transglutaminaseTgpA domain-containing protein [Ilumatobacteraceae bacterium]
MKLSAALMPKRAELVDGVVMLLLSALAVYAFRSSYGGTEYLVLGTTAALLGIVLAHIAVSFKWPLPVSAAAAVVVYAVVGGAASLHDRAIGGFLPSPASIITALRSIITGWKELITTAPPVGNTGDLMVLPFLGGFVAGLVGYVLARTLKSAAPSLLAPTVLLGVAIATGTDRPVSLVLDGCIFGALAVGWLAWREHLRRPLLEGARASRQQLVMGVGVLVVASLIGFAVAGSLPFAHAQQRTIWRQTVTPPFDPRQYPSPLSGYRHYVKEAAVKDQVMFTVEGLPEGVPVRLATMDAYDGLVWQVTSGDAEDPSLNDSGSFERVGASLEPEFPGEMATVTVTIGKYNDVWIPDVGEVRSLEFTGSAGGRDRDRELADAFRYNRATDTAASRLRLREGDRYVMHVRLPVVYDGPEAFAGKELIPTEPRLGPSMSVPKIVEKLQSDLLTIKDTGARLDAAKRLMTEGTYSDGDSNSGQQGSRAGHSSFRLTEFVNFYPKSPLIGNAEQYAATFALLFRDLDHLPTRVVMGFKPSKASTGAPVQVLAREVEAWVEVPVKDAGWVAIFPTPPRDQLALSASAEQQPEPDYRTQNPPPPPLIDPEFEESATASGKAKSTKKTEPPKAAVIEDNGQGFLSGPAGLVVKVVGVPLLLLLLVATTIVALKVRRRRRRRPSGAPHARIANGWREVTDLALDMGRPVPATTTRREAASFVGASTGHLATRADEVVWGGGEPTDDDVDQYWAELSATLRSMRSELGLVDKVKTAVSLRSLKVSQRLSRVGRKR